MYDRTIMRGHREQTDSISLVADTLYSQNYGCTAGPFPTPAVLVVVFDNSQNRIAPSLGKNDVLYLFHFFLKVQGLVFLGVGRVMPIQRFFIYGLTSYCSLINKQFDHVCIQK